MRALAVSAFLLVACGDDQPPPIDALVEHITPSDLGTACSGGPAGCFNVFTQLGGRCQERCVSIGNWHSICTGLCANDNDCSPAAPHCVDVDTRTRVCMDMTGNPNEGCPNPTDGGLPIDGNQRDAPTTDAD